MTTYYVRPTNGNDGNAGTSFAAAWKTTQKAADTAVAGDEVRLCNEASELPSAKIDFDTNAGAATNPIRFVGANSTDGTALTTGFYTLDGASLGATTDLIDATSGTADHVWWERVRFTNSTRYGINGNSAESQYWVFKHCRIDNHDSYGVHANFPWNPWAFFDCEIDHNSYGLFCDTGDRGIWYLHNCKIHHNTNDGACSGEANDKLSEIVGCEFYRNGGAGARLGTIQGNLIEGNTFYLNTGDGLVIAGGAFHVVKHNSFSSNGGYGINFNADPDEACFCDYNHYYNNTSGETDRGVGSTPGTHNQSGDPLFVLVTEGSENFVPKLGSPLLGSGLMGVTIGARNNTDFPIQDNVTEDDTTANETGQYHEATESEVQSGVAFGADSGLTGTYSGGGGGLIRHPGMAGGLNA